MDELFPESEDSDDSLFAVKKSTKSNSKRNTKRHKQREFDRTDDDMSDDKMMPKGRTPLEKNLLKRIQAMKTKRAGNVWFDDTSSSDSSDSPRYQWRKKTRKTLKDSSDDEHAVSSKIPETKITDLSESSDHGVASVPAGRTKQTASVPAGRTGTTVTTENEGAGNEPTDGAGKKAVPSTAIPTLAAFPAVPGKLAPAGRTATTATTENEGAGNEPTGAAGKKAVPSTAIPTTAAFPAVPGKLTLDEFSELLLASTATTGTRASGKQADENETVPAEPPEIVRAGKETHPNEELPAEEPLPGGSAQIAIPSAPPANQPGSERPSPSKASSPYAFRKTTLKKSTQLARWNSDSPSEDEEEEFLPDENASPSNVGAVVNSRRIARGRSAPVVAHAGIPASTAASLKKSTHKPDPMTKNTNMELMWIRRQPKLLHW